jgi:hypothetical protein
MDVPDENNIAFSNAFTITLPRSRRRTSFPSHFGAMSGTVDDFVPVKASAISKSQQVFNKRPATGSISIRQASNFYKSQ